MAAIGCKTVATAVNLANRHDPTLYTPGQLRLLAIGENALAQTLHETAPLEWQAYTPASDMYYAFYNGSLIEAGGDFFHVHVGSGPSHERVTLSASDGPRAAVLAASLHGAARAASNHQIVERRSFSPPEPTPEVLAALDKVLG
jgi:hypothetical protein